MSDTGRYHRNIWDERKRYVSLQAQASEDGLPIYPIDADFRDGAMMAQHGVQRLSQTMHPGGAFIEDSFLISLAKAPYDADNFQILGRRAFGGVDVVGAETAAAGYVGGYRVSLFQTTDFNCVQRLAGTFDPAAAAAIHRKWTAAAAGYIDDHRAMYEPGALIGLTVRIADGDHVITGNTAHRILIPTYAGGDLPITPDGDRFYFIKVPAPAGQVDVDIYLDVYIEDTGAADDPALNHNQGGSTLEAFRRNKIIQQVFFNWPTVPGNVPSQPLSDHVDAGGVQHYVTKLATLPL